MKYINRFTIQILAIVTMTIDHFAFIFVPYSNPYYNLLRGIGRLSFPLFAFLASMGVKHTHSRTKYFLRLLGLGLVIELGFYLGSLFIDGLVKEEMNILMTLAIGVGTSFLLLHEKKWVKPLAIIPILLLALAQLYCPSVKIGNYYQSLLPDYQLYGVLLIVAFSVFDRADLQALSFVIIAFIFNTPNGLLSMLHFKLNVQSYSQEYALLTIPLLFLYNGNRGPKLPKWFTYLYYPFHLVALYLLSMFI